MNIDYKSDIETLLERRALQQISKKRVIPILSSFAEKEKNRTMQKALKHIYKCYDQVLQVGKVISPNRCKVRGCPICEEIRQHQSYHSLRDAVRSWDECLLITLTSPSCDSSELELEICKYIKKFSHLMRKIRREYKVVFIRGIEIDFNIKDQKYNVHLHILLNSESAAKSIITWWISSGPKGVLKACQSVKYFHSIKERWIALRYILKGALSKLISKSKYHPSELNAYYEILKSSYNYRLITRSKRISKARQPIRTKIGHNTPINLISYNKNSKSYNGY